MGFGFVAAGGAKAGADALRDLLATRFKEQMQREEADRLRQQADDERSYRQSTLGLQEKTYGLAAQKFSTEQKEKTDRIVKLRAYAADEHNPPALRTLAAAQASEIEGLGSVNDLYGPAGHVPTLEEQHVAKFATEHGYDDPSQMPDELWRTYNQQKTDDTTRPMFLSTDKGFQAANAGRAVTPPGAPAPGAPAPGATATPLRAMPPPGSTTPGGIVRQFVPPTFLQGGEGIVTGNRMTGTTSPTINTTTGQQEQLPPIVTEGTSGPMRTNRGGGTARPLTVEGTGEPVGKAASPGTAERMGVFRATIDDIRDLIALKNDAWIGPAGQYDTLAREKVPGLPPNDPQATFAAKTAQIKSRIINAVTGKQLSEAEGARILAMLPLLENKPAVWNARARAVLEDVTRQMSGELKLTGVTTGFDESKIVTRAEIQRIADIQKKPYAVIEQQFKDKHYTIR